MKAFLLVLLSALSALAAAPILRNVDTLGISWDWPSGQVRMQFSALDAEGDSVGLQVRFHTTEDLEWKEAVLPGKYPTNLGMDSVNWSAYGSVGMMDSHLILQARAIAGGDTSAWSDSMQVWVYFFYDRHQLLGQEGSWINLYNADTTSGQPHGLQSKWIRACMEPCDSCTISMQVSSVYNSYDYVGMGRSYKSSGGAYLRDTVSTNADTVCQLWQWNYWEDFPKITSGLVRIRPLIARPGKDTVYSSEYRVEQIFAPLPDTSFSYAYNGGHSIYTIFPTYSIPDTALRVGNFQNSNPQITIGGLSLSYSVPVGLGNRMRATTAMPSPRKLEWNSGTGTGTNSCHVTCNLGPTDTLRLGFRPDASLRPILIASDTAFSGWVGCSASDSLILELKGNGVGSFASLDSVILYRPSTNNGSSTFATVFTLDDPLPDYMDETIVWTDTAQGIVWSAKSPLVMGPKNRIPLPQFCSSIQGAPDSVAFYCRVNYAGLDTPRVSFARFRSDIAGPWAMVNPRPNAPAQFNPSDSTWFIYGSWRPQWDSMRVRSGYNGTLRVAVNAGGIQGGFTDIVGLNVENDTPPSASILARWMQHDTAMCRILVQDDSEDLLSLGVMYHADEEYNFSKAVVFGDIDSLRSGDTALIGWVSRFPLPDSAAYFGYQSMMIGASDAIGFGYYTGVGFLLHSDDFPSVWLMEPWVVADTLKIPLWLDAGATGDSASLHLRVEFENQLLLFDQVVPGMETLLGYHSDTLSVPLPNSLQSRRGSFHLEATLQKGLRRMKAYADMGVDFSHPPRLRILRDLVERDPVQRDTLWRVPVVIEDDTVSLPSNRHTLYSVYRFPEDTTWHVFDSLTPTHDTTWLEWRPLEWRSRSGYNPNDMEFGAFAEDSSGRSAIDTLRFHYAVPTLALHAIDTTGDTLRIQVALQDSLLRSWNLTVEFTLDVNSVSTGQGYGNVHMVGNVDTLLWIKSSIVGSIAQRFPLGAYVRVNAYAWDSWGESMTNWDSIPRGIADPHPDSLTRVRDTLFAWFSRPWSASSCTWSTTRTRILPDTVWSAFRSIPFANSIAISKSLSLGAAPENWDSRYGHMPAVELENVARCNSLYNTSKTRLHLFRTPGDFDWDGVVSVADAYAFVAGWESRDSTVELAPSATGPWPDLQVEPDQRFGADDALAFAQGWALSHGALDTLGLAREAVALSDSPAQDFDWLSLGEIFATHNTPFGSVATPETLSVGVPDGLLRWSPGWNHPAAVLCLATGPSLSSASLPAASLRWQGASAAGDSVAAFAASPGNRVSGDCSFQLSGDGAAVAEGWDLRALWVEEGGLTRARSAHIVPQQLRNGPTPLVAGPLYWELRSLTGGLLAAGWAPAETNWSSFQPQTTQKSTPLAILRVRGGPARLLADLR